MTTLNEKVYLKPNVLVEPLFNQWYAWSYLISPATAAMYIANYHLKIMQSFIATPQVHQAALKNPAMIGGPFINCDPGRVGEIKELLEKTRTEQAHMIEFAEAIKALDEMLMVEATGYSLQPLYQKVPAILKGYVELTYDLDNRPSFRFFEGLLYNSPFYNSASQSLALSLMDTDKRPFVFSTPSLKDNGRLHLSIPFSSKAVDELCMMKNDSRPLSYIKEILGVNGQDDGLFATFFTTQRPRQYPSYNNENVSIRYFGHACVLIESKETSILLDPVISYADDVGIFRYTYADLPETIDYVLITHAHQDHCMFETLLQLRHKIRNLIVPRSSGGSLVDPSLRLTLQHLGFENVREIDELETININGGSITGLPFPGEHADLAVRTKIAYLVRLHNRSILGVADSNNLEPQLYEHLHRVTGDIDVLFVGMECDGAPMSWLYGPLLIRPLTRKMDQSRRFDGSDHEKAMRLVNQLHPKQVYVYAMGQEPWLTYLTSIQYTEESKPIIESNKLVDSCRSHGIVAERLYGHKQIFLESF